MSVLWGGGEPNPHGDVWGEEPLQHPVCVEVWGTPILSYREPQGLRYRVGVSVLKKPQVFLLYLQLPLG